jgi:hypothetical protein
VSEGLGVTSGEEASAGAGAGAGYEAKLTSAGSSPSREVQEIMGFNDAPYYKDHLVRPRRRTTLMRATTKRTTKA